MQGRYQWEGCSVKVKQRARALFLQGPVTPCASQGTFNRKLKISFLITCVYAILYGIYEYFIVYTYGFFDGNGKLIYRVIQPWQNWMIMFGGISILLLAGTRFNIELFLMGLLFQFMLEDLAYWMCQWIDTGVYPFPAPNWWDTHFASFRILGGLGWALPFWPYMPFYYLPGFGAVIAYYLAAVKGPRFARMVSWTIGPLLAAILLGTMLGDLGARVVLIILPAGLYAYGGSLLYLKRKERTSLGQNDS
ncbi:hypothetical protein GF325_07285 [Candidatus Bathyarchaeota archaeon]|nr:hypothetical protein [Candidatus Bathyarchaeota archaeon]